jgi:hypothetical protein
MCQGCVEDGRISQEELDTAILSGDLSVMPIMDLSEGQLGHELFLMIREAVAAGMDLEAAVDEARILWAAWAVGKVLGL